LIAIAKNVFCCFNNNYEIRPDDFDWESLKFEAGFAKCSNVSAFFLGRTAPFSIRYMAR